MISTLFINILIIRGSIDVPLVRAAWAFWFVRHELAHPASCYNRDNADTALVCHPSDLVHWGADGLE
jgi:hypothetical protein